MADSLIETVRIIDGRAPLWPLHRWRMMQSALALGLPMPDVAEPSGGVDRILRYEVGAEGVQLTERELAPPDAITLSSSPAPHRGYLHKTTARAWLEAARTTSRVGGADDALLFDDKGRLVEATRFAVGWWDGETLCFPPLKLGGLRSVARARLTEMVRSGLREEVLTRDQLAKKSFVACNAARGLVSVGMLDNTPLHENPRTEPLSKRFWDRANA